VLFRVQLRTTFYERLEALQGNPDHRLEYYNRKRPHQGYRHRGQRPYDTVQADVKTRHVCFRALASPLTVRQES